MNRSKNRYKRVKWLFGKEIEIPEDWEIKKLGAIGDIISGGTPDSTNAKYWNGGILWAVPTDITKLSTLYIDDTERKITKDGLENSSAKLLPVGTILVTSRATIGKCAIAAKPMATNQGFQNIICDDNFDRGFIFYAIKHNSNSLLRLAYGTTFLEISKAAIKNIAILVPKKNTQTKIASILSAVDAAIVSTQKVIEKTEELKKGLMQKLLTRGIGHTKFKKVKWHFGKEVEIPRDWEIKKLRAIGDIIGGGTPDSTNAKYWNGDILWAVPTDITKLSVSYIDDTERKITKNGLENSSAKLLPVGTILVTSRATIGKCAIAAKPMATNQGFQNIICDDNFDRGFIFYAIKHNSNSLLRLAYGTTFLEISKAAIRNIAILVPKKNIQTKIASILSEIDAYIQKNQEYKKRLGQLKKGLMQKLLTGQIRIKIDH